MSNMIITRLPRDKEHPFTMTTNAQNGFNWDSRLSPGAYGVLCKVLSLNPEKDFSVSWLCTLMNAGKTAIRNCLKELKQFGYLIIKKVRDELGRFTETLYYFYETSQLGEQEGEMPCNFSFHPHSTNPEMENRPQSNTAFSLNTADGQSVGLGKTDGLSAKSEKNIISREQFAELEGLIKEYTAFDFLKAEMKNFVTEVTGRLEDGILSGLANLDDVVGKIREIAGKEKNIVIFMNKLQDWCSTALRNLKNPGAKDKFLRKVIFNKLMEYQPQKETPPSESLPEQKAEVKKSAAALSFPDMLRRMRYPEETLREIEKHAENESDIEDAIDALDDDKRLKNIRKCMIPESFTENPETMEKALLFLTDWYNFVPGEQKSFVRNSISMLTETLCTGRYCRGFDPCILISKLNYLNWEKPVDNMPRLSDFMASFFDHYCRQIYKYRPEKNSTGYTAAMLISYILRDYAADRMRMDAAMNNADRGNYQKGRKA